MLMYLPRVKFERLAMLGMLVFLLSVAGVASGQTPQILKEGEQVATFQVENMT